MACWLMLHFMSFAWAKPRFDGLTVPEPHPDDAFEVILAANDQQITIGTNASEFSVVLRNKTDKPQRLYEYWNSWGFQNVYLCFYVKDSIQVASKKVRDFTRNFPSLYEIAPGGTMVFPIKIDDTWENLPTFEQGEFTMRLLVVYYCEPTFLAKKQNAWTGIMASKGYTQKFRNTASTSKPVTPAEEASPRK